MIKLDDLVTLAKAGWTPKQVKEVIEMIDTSPKAQGAGTVINKNGEVDIKTSEQNQPKDNNAGANNANNSNGGNNPEDEDPMEILKKLIKED